MKRSAGAARSIAAVWGLALTVGVTGSGTAVASSAPHWRVVQRNHLAVDNAYTGVLAFGRADAWAIGQKSGTVTSMVMHWNGKSWQRMPLPVSNFDVQAIEASGPANVWIIGSIPPTENSEVLRWDGQWHVMTPPPFLSPLGDMAVLGPSQALVPGGSTISDTTDVWLWDGGITTDYPLPALLTDISESSNGSVWAIGQGRRPHSLVRAYTWTGSGWARVQIPAVHGPFAHLAAWADNDVWIQGLGTTPDQLGRYPQIFLHWNGKRWRRIPSPYAAGYMAPDGHGGVWADSSSHWSHGHWITTAPATPGPPQWVASGLVYLDAVPGTHSMYAAGGCWHTRKGPEQGTISVFGPLP